MKPLRPGLVSVIVPVFDAAPWIAETLQSISAQTWLDLEILVVDDGSTDDSIARARSVDDARVRIIEQANAGSAAARNTGLREAQGEWIQFLDADDLLSPTKIAAQVEALGRTRDAVASCAWYPFTDTPANARPTRDSVWLEADPVRWLIRSLSGEGMMQPAGWLIPRRVVERAGSWNESLSLHDDAEYFTRVLVNSKRNVFVKEPAVFYRDTPRSLSRRRSRAAAESSLNACLLRQSTLLSIDESTEMRTALATQFAQCAYEFSNTYPDVAQRSLAEISRLGATPANVIGGRGFRSAVEAVGFRRALWIRSLLGRGSRKVHA